MREGDRPPFCTRPIISSLMRNSTSPLLSLSRYICCLSRLAILFNGLLFQRLPSRFVYIFSRPPSPPPPPPRFDVLFFFGHSRRTAGIGETSEVSLFLSPRSKRPRVFFLLLSFPPAQTTIYRRPNFVISIMTFPISTVAGRHTTGAAAAAGGN